MSRTIDEAAVAGVPYRWIAIDLDATVGPSEAIGTARSTWPDARLAVLSCWWSERDAFARETADVVLHKPVRSAEMLSFLRPPADVSIPPLISSRAG
jgi:hypothetical protein